MKSLSASSINEFEVEGEYFFASIILRKDHPDCDTLLGQFDGFAADLRDKQE